jgi:hypothetical protein
MHGQQDRFGRVRRVAALLGMVCALMLSAVLASGPAQAQQGRHPAVPVLGSKKFAGGYGSGWGTAHPKEFFNGGDPSGDVYSITWQHWGNKRSYGWGKNAIFKPGGGYYRHAVRIQVRAQSLGYCGTHRAYTHLWVREPSKPGGPLGKWHPWSYHNRTLCKNGFGG